ncbi:MAG: acyltransferase family protein, partial [Oscillospiraceae bacterium]
MAKTIDGRTAYADLLRVAATLAVIVIHCTAEWLEASAIGSANWNILNVLNGASRWCVPMFVMLSGMFFLDPQKSVTLPSLFFKSILRIVVALVAWGTVYAMWTQRPTNGVYTIQWLWGALKSVLLGDTHYHLWFLYMIIGLYLLTPFLRAFVKGASRSDFHYFFALVFVFSSLLPTLLTLRPSTTVTFYIWRMYLSTGMGYIGYYLKTYTLGRISEFIVYLLGILGSVVTIGGTLLLSRQGGAFNQVFYQYFSPNVAFMAVAVFVLFRYVLGVSEERSRRQRLGG